MRINKLLASIACIAMIASTFVGCGNSGYKTTTTEASSQTTSTEAETLNTDVVIIGGGGGGLSAAIEAHDAVANVIIV